MHKSHLLAVAGVALLAWSLGAHALAVDKIKLLDPVPNCLSSSSQVLATMPPIDVEVTPGTVVKLSADPSGLSSVTPAFARLSFGVKSGPGGALGAISEMFNVNSGSACTVNGGGPYDVTRFFPQPGVYTVELTVLAGGTDSVGNWRGFTPMLYLVATQGHVASVQGTQG